jgi:hypothetical protein
MQVETPASANGYMMQVKTPASAHRRHLSHWFGPAKKTG